MQFPGCWTLRHKGAVEDRVSRHHRIGVARTTCALLGHGRSVSRPLPPTKSKLLGGEHHRFVPVFVMPTPFIAMSPRRSEGMGPNSPKPPTVRLRASDLHSASGGNRMRGTVIRAPAQANRYSFLPPLSSLYRRRPLRRLAGLVDSLEAPLAFPVDRRLPQVVHGSRVGRSAPTRTGGRKVQNGARCLAATAPKGDGHAGYREPLIGARTRASEGRGDLYPTATLTEGDSLLVS